MGDERKRVIRKNITVATLNKIKDFLKNQEEPIYKSEIVKQLNVDYNSLNLALEMLEIQIDPEGRVKLKC